jgi:hypothetical protein
MWFVSGMIMMYRHAQIPVRDHHELPQSVRDPCHSMRFVFHRNMLSIMQEASRRHGGETMGWRPF